MWQFAFNAGPRHGEIAALAWDDVDLQAGTVHIQRNLTGHGDFVPPKTRAGDRVITLLAPALEALRAQFSLTGHLPETEIVQHFREYGKKRFKSIVLCFCRGSPPAPLVNIFQHNRSPTAGMHQSKKRVYVDAHHISHVTPTHVGHWLLVPTRHSLPANLGMKMLRWSTGCIQLGSKNSMVNRLRCLMND